MSAQLVAAAFDLDQTAPTRFPHIQSNREGFAMSDFCYSRPTLNLVLQQAELMDSIMELLGVDTATAARLDMGTAWYEARTRCIACHSEWQCQDWLRHPPVKPSMEPPDFCHNSAFFRRCGVSSRG
jgi:hypothetical protein